MGYFPPFDTCLDTFAAAAAALKESEKKSSGGNGGDRNESSVGNSLGISDYGLWHHPAPSVSAAAAATPTPPAPPAFPFPYSFFWPSKRPPTTPFSPFHASILGNYVSTHSTRRGYVCLVSYIHYCSLFCLRTLCLKISKNISFDFFYAENLLLLKLIFVNIFMKLFQFENTSFSAPFLRAPASPSARFFERQFL